MKKSILLTALVAITLSVMTAGCKGAQQTEAPAPAPIPAPEAAPAPAPAPEGLPTGQPGQ